MKAIILAAGEGIRLRPLTETRPKPMLVAGGKPIIHHLLSQAGKAGVSEAVVVVRHMKESIMGYLSKADLGLKVSFIEQGQENGTGAALLCAEKEISDTFIALAGDIVTEASVIKAVMDAHEGGITLGLKRVPNPHEYGVVELSNGRISLFEEKPKHPKTDLANLSVYCMEPTVFSELRSVGKSERGEHEIVNLFVGAKGVVCEGYWRDIAYPWDLLEANEHLLSNMESKSGHIENSTIDGKVIMEDGARIINSYVEGCAYIGEGTVIGPNACLKGCNSIGKNCSIGSGTTIKNSILLDNVNAKHLSYIGDSVIGENVNFGSGTQVANYRFDSENVNVLGEKGWVNSGRKKLGVFVGDNTKFGVLSCTMPGKLIGANCEIHSGVIVNKNVPSGVRVFSRQPIEFGKTGGE
ncbi:MAG: bifunctional sugar-1-phosphate nucleotidylyltransferase/acetyltransferase [Candidatus Micrarchaeia archaeon]